MAIEYSRLRQIVLDHLRIHPEDQVNLYGDNFVRAQAARLDLPYTPDDGMRVIEIFHELYREGIIDSGTGESGSQAMRWPFYRVSTWGRQVLSTREYVPYDPEGYLGQLRTQIANIDDIILRYLEEALACFRHSRFLAASVMLGCAAEKSVLLLTASFGKALADSTVRAQFESAVGKKWMISAKYEEMWKRLQGKLPVLPAALADDLHVILDRVFDLIRVTRNDAGHPTGKVIERETVNANLILFPTYCKRIYALIAHFSQHTV